MNIIFLNFILFLVMFFIHALIQELDIKSSRVRRRILISALVSLALLWIISYAFPVLKTL